MTEKLYYENSHLAQFTARVTGCEEVKKDWGVSLDRTAFFPEGGGQSGDTGFIGDVRVTDTQEKNGEILHYTDAPLEIGAEYSCAIDWEQRFHRMQNHSGEHIVSGLVHRMYGYDNVGFHMGAQCVTIDFNGELTKEQLCEIERLANDAVTKNLKITAQCPPKAELEKMEYRSKKELSGEVRIVTVEGVDVCACCAPHVSLTGEIGLIKILSSMRHRGGVRIDMLCGKDAMEDYACKQDSVTAISQALSAKPHEVAQAVERITEENEELKYRCGELGREVVKARLDAINQTEGNICLFDDLLSDGALRELINGAVLKCSGLAAVFRGNDGAGYKYIIGSQHLNLRAMAADINAGVSGRGGGSAEMIQGSATKTAKEIQDFLSKLEK